MLERGVTPVIPEKGSVGASGDLAPWPILRYSDRRRRSVLYKANECRVLSHCKEHKSRHFSWKLKRALRYLMERRRWAQSVPWRSIEQNRLIRLADVAGAMTLEALRELP